MDRPIPTGQSETFTILLDVHPARFQDRVLRRAAVAGALAERGMEGNVDLVFAGKELLEVATHLQALSRREDHRIAKWEEDRSNPENVLRSGPAHRALTSARAMLLALDNPDLAALRTAAELEEPEQFHHVREELAVLAKGGIKTWNDRDRLDSTRRGLAELVRIGATRRQEAFAEEILVDVESALSSIDFVTSPDHPLRAGRPVRSAFRSDGAALLLELDSIDSRLRCNLRGVDSSKSEQEKHRLLDALKSKGIEATLLDDPSDQGGTGRLFGEHLSRLFSTDSPVTTAPAD